MSQAKIVELKVEGTGTFSLPPIVHTIRQQTKKRLAELLQSLFNNVDDALFELADRSQSDGHQEMYFDSMRMIRLHRKTLASCFLSGFVESFNAAFTCESQSEICEDDYTLLDQEELEMNVAVSGIVSKVTSHYSLAIMQLTKRLDSLSKEHNITERRNPLGPYALSTAFADALSALEVDIKIRIILMKMFERFVMECLDPVYEAANRSLIDAGVLPDIKGKPSRSDARQGQRKAPLVQSTRSENSVTQGKYNQRDNSTAFATIQSLLAGAKQSNGTNGTADGVLSLPALNSDELIHTLSQLQESATPQLSETSQIPELMDLRTLVLTQPGAENKSLRRADDDTVNFIGMLFDYILNDRNLAIPMKALIGRLQIPIVKLAILDKSFFGKSGHPARALLNELSSAGIGWSSARELKRDALYDKIESIVLRVLNEFTDSAEIFSDLLDDLREFVSKDNRRSVLIEQRVKESEAGKAKTKGAKLKVQSLVNQKACGLRLPCEAGKFLSEVWCRVLTLRLIKFGDDSSAWTDGVQTLDDMIWSMQPLSEPADVENRDRLSAKLVSDIVDGMHELACPQDEIHHYRDWLSDHLKNLSENDRAFLDEDERPATGFEEKPVAEIVLTAPSPAFDEATLTKETMQKIQLITEGSWVEVNTPEERKLRCKLATITQPGDTYVFVNRRGMKVLEKSRGELALLTEEENLKRIDESEVFDRALQTVIGNLRSMQRERAR